MIKVKGCWLMRLWGVQRMCRFGTDVLYLDRKNSLTLEASDTQIRIDAICASDRESLNQMLDAIQEIASVWEGGISRIVYADKLADDLAEMLLAYGFQETKLIGACDPNRYLTLKRDGEKASA